MNDQNQEQLIKRLESVSDELSRLLVAETERLTGKKIVAAPPAGDEFGEWNQLHEEVIEASFRLNRISERARSRKKDLQPLAKTAATAHYLSRIERLISHLGTGREALRHIGEP